MNPDATAAPVEGNLPGRGSGVTNGDAHPGPTPVAPPATGRQARRLRWRGYFRMGRTIRYENWLGTPLWWCALPGAVAFTRTTLVLVPLTLLVYMSMVATGGTLDDVQGFRDGSDRINYLRSDPTGLRPITRKPLLLGWVTERQAIHYATAAAVTCVAALIAAWLVAGARPLWWLPAYAGVLVAGSQYSFGLKLSYLGAQEVLFSAVKVCCVVFPYVLVTGALPAGMAATGVVFGLWFLQVLTCSNIHDIEGDRQAGRRTLAVMTSEATYRWLLGALFVLSWSVPVVALVAGWWSPWLFVATVPAGFVHGYQIYLVNRRRLPLQGRAMGFWALRIGVVGLCLAYLGVR